MECKVLERRCAEVFSQYVNREYGGPSLDLQEGLLIAFEQGTEVSRHGGDLSLCPYNAVSDPERFLAWVEGFQCCSVSRTL